MTGTDEHELTGTTVSRYSIGDLIGAGGMGQVYRARDERLHRNVAVKVLSRRDEPCGRGERELVTEARALSRLSHPHVAAIYDFLTESGRDFIVMEFVPGSTLKEILASCSLPFAEVVRLGRQMAQALAAAHAAQVVHRDIKPANLKVTENGELKILDFGLAQLMPCIGVKEISTHSPAEFGPAGTIPYMSPEQLRGEVADERSDIFSAGAVLYEMATGRPAFPQAKMVQLIDAVLHQDPVPPSTISLHIHATFDRLVNKAMQKRPAKRYQSARELDAALECLIAARTRGLTSTLSGWFSDLLGRTERTAFWRTTMRVSYTAPHRTAEVSDRGFKGVSSVPELLEELGLQDYASIFADNLVDLRTLLVLTDADLEELKDRNTRSLPYGPRKLLIHALTEIRATGAPTWPLRAAISGVPNSEHRHVAVLC
jgi:serine/threonine protein kinase